LEKSRSRRNSEKDRRRWSDKRAAIDLSKGEAEVGEANYGTE